MMSKKPIPRAAMMPLAAAALVLIFASSGAGAHAARLGLGTPPVGPCDPTITSCVSTIAFSSTRDHVSEGLIPPLLGAEVYLVKPVMNLDGTWALTNPRRLTSNTSFDGFGNLSPDGKQIVFDSTRAEPVDPLNPLNPSDLFLMNTDGTEQTLLTRGASATWSPDSKNIAFHASASGSGTPLRTDPGSATSDSDIFVANVDDLLAGVEQPRNLTNSPDKIDEDADWSPNGQKIAYTAHDVGDEGPNWPRGPFISNTAEIYVVNADGTGTPTRLTDNGYEERAPASSPDGSRIVHSCRIGGGTTVFQICVINAAVNPDGTLPVPTQLTNDTFGDLTATFSPDGQYILFHRRVGPPGSQQLFIMNASLNADGTLPQQTQLTFGTPTSPDGVNNLAHWGELRLMGPNAAP